MRLGEILIAEKLAERADIDAAQARRSASGGDLGEALMEMGVIDPVQLAAVKLRRPHRPKSIEETGLSQSFLIGLLLKCMYVNGLQTASEITNEMKLSGLIVQRLVDQVRERQFIEPLGSSARPNNPYDLHFALSDLGRARAIEALKQSEYVGPAPVTLAAFEAQIAKQRLAGELVGREALREGLSHLMVSPELLDRVGPALNAGQPILMYGPPGNGKSSISSAAARCFNQMIYLPYCFEVDNQIVKVFDPTLHEEVERGSEQRNNDAAGVAVRQSTYDPRWVCCRRPRISAGVELTLEMMDLNFHPNANYYDAPLQMKASGGVLLVDDFGRQLIRPIDILNRWVIPLEHGVDYLTLETGRKFACAFDAVLIFSTNLALKEVMETDLMRRIPYRIRVDAPSRDEFAALLRNECAGRDIELPEDLLSHLLDDQYVARDRPFARYHPRFIVEHALASARYEQVAPRLDNDILTHAMEDLFTAE